MVLDPPAVSWGHLPASPPAASSDFVSVLARDVLDSLFSAHAARVLGALPGSLSRTDYGWHVEGWLDCPLLPSAHGALRPPRVGLFCSVAPVGLIARLPIF